MVCTSCREEYKAGGSAFMTVVIRGERRNEPEGHPREESGLPGSLRGNTSGEFPDDDRACRFSGPLDSHAKQGPDTGVQISSRFISGILPCLQAEGVRQRRPAQGRASHTAFAARGSSLAAVTTSSIAVQILCWTRSLSSRARTWWSWASMWARMNGVTSPPGSNVSPRHRSYVMRLGGVPPSDFSSRRPSLRPPGKARPPPLPHRVAERPATRWTGPPRRRRTSRTPGALA
jgi:hypothetical protein